MSELEDYRIEGTNIVNFTKWSRENIPKPPHRLPLGQVVDVEIDHFCGEKSGHEIGMKGMARLIVVGHHYDCDGTALYAVASEPIPMPHGIVKHMEYQGLVKFYFHGYTEEGLKPADGPLVPLVAPWWDKAVVLQDGDY